MTISELPKHLQKEGDKIMKEQGYEKRPENGRVDSWFGWGASSQGVDFWNRLHTAKRMEEIRDLIEKFFPFPKGISNNFPIY